MGACVKTPAEVHPTSNTAIKKQQIPDDDDTTNSDNKDNTNNFLPNDMDDKNYLIQILRGINVPKMDLASASDPYIILKVISSQSSLQKGSNIRTLYRLDNDNPIWNCYRTFEAGFNDSLLFELWEKDFLVGDKDDFIGNASIKISDIFVNIDDHHITSKKSNKLVSRPTSSHLNDDEEYIEELIINLKHKKNIKKNAKKNLKTKIYFKLFEIKCTPNTIEKKTIFFIRHGESKWNNAKHNKSIIKMYKQVDHPLNVNGINQAISFNKFWKNEQNNDDNVNDLNDLNDFLAAEIIYSSPLCRASQTAILTLLDHKCLTKNGIKFARNLREIKRIGGADTLANKTGKKQINKIITNILQHKNDINYINKYENMIQNININANDSDDNQKWWSASVDTKNNFYERINDFMYYIRYSYENNIICVGHSLWIKGFFNRYININNINQYSSKDLLKDMINDNDNDDIFNNNNNNDNNVRNDTKELMNDLQKKKVENAGCVRVDISFSDSFQHGLKITDVKLLFNTKLIDKNATKKQKINT